ncbi:MAG: Primosomal protein N' [Parcubacteria group bacterium GW2011_GWF2_39_8b]|uniref:Primosomal protein N' 3' DNA-binding domain-containing protein n=2 Tax=Candidatus Zambryskiibacteriota TaxID=1817925 RepID=A0A1G2TBK8_9BACT|nr:MAG: Primosomal protein N' [Parcubacteria group bacterium GW2011_GWF2_39_8b]KKR45183.1 MAG: Primosomal protein N' [Parcubacteria group bacterium GW2011_GWA2_40_14]OHA93991.1 MAG: hypothetical protein A2W58_01880 [Candidatus Zambryskibacteria bacterium RIFCSPHIGHO2_02_38_10.5]OHA98542.1 MAG: hypothetical protein A3E32_03175 [Candidatus Zambryskibacteria bacterium RIFCSPHIGHO2_12_FULL_38_37]OHB13143.1 MAG: hypothetical protein A3G47_02010 [Candidatus Zambryskibacteria bacterium RIFCSPLOWO2_12_
MRILTVIPIAKGITKDTLTYFTKKEVAVGSIVSIPLRKKMVYGLVTGSRSATEIKSELKSLSYSIKKIDNIQSRSFLSDSFVQSVQKIADYNAASAGAVLSALIPTAILENSGELSYKKKEPPAGIFHETVLLQTDDEERSATYRSLIREEFARGRSVFFLLPTTEDLLNAHSTLEKGIEKYTYTLHSGLSKKEIVAKWKEIVSEEHPVLLVATGQFLSLPRSDLGTIILENESSRGYKMQGRPFIDIRTAAEIITKEAKVRLILGDMFLRIETLWAEKNQEKNITYSELVPLKFRSLTSSVCEIENTKSPADMKKKEFAIFGVKLKNLIKRARENNEHSFLFCGRKGLYPLTVCTDCGTIVVCKNCNAPVVLYGNQSINPKHTAGLRLFVCHHCGERRNANELCLHCGGWRLNPMGIGLERVVKEIETFFPEAKVVVMEGGSVTTHKQAVKARNLFYNTPGAILVGTEMALTYLNQKIENTTVVSIDSYFSIPDFRINEKVFHILLAIQELSEKNFLIQTRQERTSAPWKIFDYALRGNLIDFYRDEIEDRKKIGYPPFTTYIKITLEGEKTAVKKQMDDISSILKPYELSVFDAWNPGSAKKFSVHGLISLPKEKWPDKILLQKLHSLPPYVMIKVDPDTLL